MSQTLESLRNELASVMAFSHRISVLGVCSRSTRKRVESRSGSLAPKTTARPRYFLFPWSVRADPLWLRSVLTVDDCGDIRSLPKRLNPVCTDLASNPGCFRRHKVEGFARSTRRSSLPSQLQPHADHGAARIREDGRTSEIWAVQIVRRQTFLGSAVQHVEHVQEEFDTSQFAREDGPRHAQIEQ